MWHRRGDISMSTEMQDTACPKYEAAAFDDVSCCIDFKRDQFIDRYSFKCRLLLGDLNSDYHLV